MEQKDDTAYEVPDAFYQRRSKTNQLVSSITRVTLDEAKEEPSWSRSNYTWSLLPVEVDVRFNTGQLTHARWRPTAVFVLDEAGNSRLLVPPRPLHTDPRLAHTSTWEFFVGSLTRAIHKCHISRGHRSWKQDPPGVVHSTEIGKKKRTSSWKWRQTSNNCVRKVEPHWPGTTCLTKLMNVKSQRCDAVIEQ